MRNLMLTFLNFITEAAASGYSDEYALATMWDHAVSHPEASRLLSHPDHLHREIEAAKKDKKHPLNFANAHDGFTGGKKPEHEAAYYNELRHAAYAVHGMASHPSFKKAVSQKYQARVTGSEKGELSDTWKNSGAKNRTSKADIVLTHPKKPKERIGISLKKGDSQLMSAEPNEFHATYSHALAEHAKTNNGFTQQHHREVMSHVEKIQSNLNAMQHTNDRTELHRLRDEAQQHLDDIHDKHPGLLQHVAHEASTGHGKFGHGATGTATHLVTTMAGQEPHIHDTETNNQPIEVKKPRIALPKGKKKDGTNRPGNVKLDYRTKK